MDVYQILLHAHQILSRAQLNSVACAPNSCTTWLETKLGLYDQHSMNLQYNTAAEREKERKVGGSATSKPLLKIESHNHRSGIGETCAKVIINSYDKVTKFFIRSVCVCG